MAIGKNKRLTKRVAASGGNSEDCSTIAREAKASRAAARIGTVTLGTSTSKIGGLATRSSK